MASMAAAAMVATVAGMVASDTVVPAYPERGAESIREANTIYAYTGTLTAPDGSGKFRAIKIGLDVGDLGPRSRNVGQYAAVVYHAQQQRIKKYVKETAKALGEEVEDLLFEGGMFWPRAPRFEPGSGDDSNQWIGRMERASHGAAEEAGLVQCFATGAGRTEWYSLRRPGTIEEDEADLRRIAESIFPELAERYEGIAIELEAPVQLFISAPAALDEDRFMRSGANFRALRGGTPAAGALSPQEQNPVHVAS